MNKKAMLVKIIIANVIIISASIYYGMQSQYFGKTLAGHIGGTLMFIVIISSLIAVSEWYNSRINK